MELLLVLWWSAFLPVLAHASSPQVHLSSQTHDEYGPDAAHAVANANLLFNSIYSSARQWGSSVQHNGMSLIPAYVPEGTLLYHGGPEHDGVIGMEWLAFEIQHAEMFAVNVKLLSGSVKREEQPSEHDLVHPDLRNQPVSLLGGLPPEFSLKPGYLQIYQTKRPLKLLYIDGMSAAKCDLGTMDTQDYILLNFTLEKMRDRERAHELCQLADELGIEGVMRMEAGFEIIMCHFEDGLDMISSKLRPEFNSSQFDSQMPLLDYMREVETRFHGIDNGRIKLDYSCSVSALFYPVNLSNPDQIPGGSILPRLASTKPEVLKRIKADVSIALARSVYGAGNDWQGVADMIVKRYSQRLQFLASEPSCKMIMSQLNSLLNLFVDHGAPAAEQNPRELCAVHYLRPIQIETDQDSLIHAAFNTVTARICDVLFDVRDVLLDEDKDHMCKIDSMSIVSSITQNIRDLNAWLDWPDWKLCKQCALDEVCFIAVFPLGAEEDHFHPSCINNTSLDSKKRNIETNYWRPRDIHFNTEG